MAFAPKLRSDARDEAVAASPEIYYVIHNTGSSSVTATDTCGFLDFGACSTYSKSIAGPGTGTAYCNVGGNIYDTLTITDSLSDAHCVQETQSVYSSFYGHYVITATSVAKYNATDGSGRTATCSESLSKNSTSGD